MGKKRQKNSRRCNKNQPWVNHSEENGTFGIAGDLSLTVVYRMLDRLNYNWIRVIVDEQKDFSNLKLPSLMASLSDNCLHIFFGWNGLAKEGKDESHYLSMRHGVFIYQT